MTRIGLSSKRDAFYFYNNLLCLVKATEKHYTTIDLHNEECVTGKVSSVDGCMNVELEDAIFYNARGEEIPFKTFFIRARSIRYVHIPISLPIFATIKNSVTNEKKVPNKPTLKQKRAIRKHDATVKQLARKK